MPRLLGKPSKTPVYFGMAFLAVLAGSAVLEYSGVINVIPGFGKGPERIIIVPQEAIEKPPIAR
jgi:hypothetical protein